MSIPTGGLAALLVVAALGLGACGGSDSSVTTTTTISPGADVETATQTVAGDTTTTKPTTQATTTQKTQTTSPKPAQTTTQKTQTTASKPKPASSSGPCPLVDVGVRDGDVDETYARITDMTKLNCQLATYILQQWGGQMIGRDKALLPLDWSCSGNTCRKGSSRVTFVLVPPSNSD